MGSGRVSKACILGLDGTVWAKSNNLEISQKEAEALVNNFLDSQLPLMNGIRVEGMSYLCLKADQRSVYGRKGSTGVLSARTCLSVIVALYSSHHNPSPAISTVEELADYLLFLDKNDTEYQKYLEWKRTGWSKDFKALVDLAHVHSNCRMCIKLYDLYRKDFQPPDYPAALVARFASQGRVYMTRARGKHEFVPIILPPPFELQWFKEMVTDRLIWTIKDFTVTQFYQLTKLPERSVINNQAEFDAVPNGADLEVIFV